VVVVLLLMKLPVRHSFEVRVLVFVAVAVLQVERVVQLSSQLLLRLLVL
jgi:hypothetical protein